MTDHRQQCPLPNLFARVAPTLAGLRVLVVDDSQTNQIILRTLLAKAGIETRCAESGPMALDMLGREPFELVLMDIQLPVVDGYETTRRIRRELGLTDLTIVAMSGCTYEEQRDASREAGMDDFLAKPVRPEALLAVMAKWKRAAVEPVNRAETPSKSGTGPGPHP